MKPLSKTVSALPVSAALAVDLRAKALCAKGRDIISFCVGEPDFDTPEPVKRAGICAIESNDTKYTNASGTQALRAAVCAVLLRDHGIKYDASNIAITTGAKYAVTASILALTDPGDEVVLPAPFWPSYDSIIRLSGATPAHIPCSPEAGWKLTPGQLERAVTPQTKALILNHPNNPTGAVYTRKELAALAKVCQAHDLFVLSDEIYSHLTYTDEPFCAAASINADMFDRTVTIGGVSKAYAMTGWRIGYVAAGLEIIRAISALLSHTTGSPNSIAQAAAVEALLGPQEIKLRMKQTFQARRDRLFEALREIPGIQFTHPQGAFYAMLDLRTLLKDGNFKSEADFALQLLEDEGVAAVPCTDFGAPGYLRLSYTLDEARMLEGVARLRRFVERNRIDDTMEP